MYKYFASYYCSNKLKGDTIGNAFFESNSPLCTEVIREFENQTKKDNKCNKVVVLSVQMLPKEG